MHLTNHRQSFVFLRCVICNCGFFSQCAAQDCFFNISNVSFRRKALSGNISESIRGVRKLVVQTLTVPINIQNNDFFEQKLTLSMANFLAAIKVNKLLKLILRNIFYYGIGFTIYIYIQ